jgi:hypothetical protein
MAFLVCAGASKSMGDVARITAAKAALRIKLLILRMGREIMIAPPC